MKVTFALLAGSAAAFAPPRAPPTARPARSARPVAVRASSLPDLLLSLELPTLVAPKESQLPFTSPFFIAFFIFSIIGGLPFLAWLRLSSLCVSASRTLESLRRGRERVDAFRGSPVDVPRREEDPDAPFDINGAARSKGVELPKLPGLPDFTLPKLGNDLREIEIPDAVAEKVGAKETGQLIDLLPWNRPDYPLKPKKGSGL